MNSQDTEFIEFLWKLVENFPKDEEWRTVRSPGKIDVCAFKDGHNVETLASLRPGDQNMAEMLAFGPQNLRKLLLLFVPDISFRRMDAWIRKNSQHLNEKCIRLLTDWSLAVKLYDVNHPSAMGCLLALVREVWKDPRAWASPSGIDWEPWLCDVHGRTFGGAYEIDCLINALEAYPFK